MAFFYQTKKIVLTTCFFSLFAFAGYAENLDITNDKTSPKIELTSPSKHFEVLRGEGIDLIANLQDNYELDSYRIVITKGGISSNKYTNTFSFSNNLGSDQKVLPNVLGLKSCSLNIKIKVDETTLVGDYDLTLYLKDKAGNEQIEKRFFYVARH